MILVLVLVLIPKSMLMLIRKLARHDHVDALIIMAVVITVMVMMTVMLMKLTMVMMRAIIDMVMITRVTLRRLRRCSCGALVTVCRARSRRQLLDVRKICLIFVPCLICETLL